MDNNLWTDFKAMLKDIKSNPAKVEQFDLPDQHIFGFKSTVDDKVWQIKVSDIKITLGSSTASQDSLLSIISSESGKAKLLEQLNVGK